MTDWIDEVKARNKDERQRKAFDRCVLCCLEETEQPNHEGSMVPSIQATCRRCDNTTRSFGSGPASETRCLWLMRETCPNRENNWYADELGDNRDWDPGRNAPG
jgi:hypothetical protein